MGWRGTIILALILVAAAAALYRELAAEHDELSWENVLGGARQRPPGDQITHLLSFDPASVTAVELRRGDRTWRVKRSDGTWAGAEQPAAIDSFLADLLNLAEIMRLDVDAADLDDHGLDPPEAVIALERAGGPPVVLLLGRRNPPATGVYARVGPQGRVVLTGALALWDFEKAVRAVNPTAAAP